MVNNGEINMVILSITSPLYDTTCILDLIWLIMVKYWLIMVNVVIYYSIPFRGFHKWRYPHIGE